MKKTSRFSKLTKIVTVVSIATLCSAFLFVHFLPIIRERWFTKPTVVAEGDNARAHIFLLDAGKKIQLSSNDSNHRDPFWRGDFIVWVDEPQNKSEKYIVRYHIPTKTQLQLTTASVAQHPKVSTEGFVVWQEWIDETWQVLYFDGSQTTEISSGSAAINPDIAGTKIVYAQKNSASNWEAVLFDTQNKTTEVILEGENAKFPLFHDTIPTFAQSE